MGRPHRSKVALVERRDFRFAQALGQRHDAGIDDPEREVRVASLQLTAASEIDAIQLFNAVDPREQIVEEDEPGLRWQPAGVGCQAFFRWPVGEEIIEPWKAWSMTTLLAVCSAPFGPDCRWELLSGGYATRGHIHHPRYVRDVHSRSGHPFAPYAQASDRLHRRTGERL
jgi:hypothetical protein